MLAMFTGLSTSVVFLIFSFFQMSFTVSVPDPDSLLVSFMIGIGTTSKPSISKVAPQIKSFKHASTSPNSPLPEPSTKISILNEPQTISPHTSLEPQNNTDTYSEDREPWMQQKLMYSERHILDNCECGKRNPGIHRHIRIVNGFSTHKHEYPWQTYLQTIENRSIIDGKSDNVIFKSCGGSIINDMFILTAAHCMVDEKIGHWRKVKVASDIIGKVMVQNRKDISGREIHFDRIIVHPGYLAFKPLQSGASVIKNLYDIALLKLSERLPLEWSPFLKPVCLPEANDHVNIQEGLLAKVVGWGLTSRGDGASASDNLLQLNFEMHNASTCDKYSRGDASRFVCGEDLYSDTGSAHGDSGGSLCIDMGSDYANKLIQIGVVSFTNTGNFTHYDEVIESYSLGYYSSVMSFLPFIDYYSSTSKARWCQRRGRMRVMGLTDM